MSPAFTSEGFKTFRSSQAARSLNNVFARVVSQELGVSCLCFKLTQRQLCLLRTELLRTGWDHQPFTWACTSICLCCIEHAEACSFATPAGNNYHTFSQSSFLSPRPQTTLLLCTLSHTWDSCLQGRRLKTCFPVSSFCYKPLHLTVLTSCSSGKTNLVITPSLSIVFKVDLCCSMTKYFSPCCGWIVFHCMEILYPFFGYLQILLMYKRLCGAIFNLFLWIGTEIKST